MKKILIIIALLLAFVFIFSACQKPNDIEKIKLEDIESATIALSGYEKQENIKTEDLEKFIEYLNNAKAYKTSTTDKPDNVESYYTINLVVSGENKVYYVYTKRINTCIEIPKVGIYKTSEKAEELFFNYFVS